VNNLQNNDLIGKVVLSKAGRDTNHLYVVIRQLDNEYVLLSNGVTKTLDKPKKKKFKHLSFVDVVNDEIKLAIVSNDNGTDLKIKRLLKFKGIVKEG
jgi:ribosomal protein L14E/L6E/L27E